jgi:hypothetical protein
MQYRLFSSNKQYLPIEPKDIVIADDLSIEQNLLPTHIDQVYVENSLSVVNGDEAFLTYLGTPKDVNLNIFRSPAPSALISDIGAIINDFINLAGLSLVEVEERMAKEAEEGILKESNKTKADSVAKINQYQAKMLKEMQSVSSRSNGYIIWLVPFKSNKKKTDDDILERSVFEIKPEPFDPSKLIVTESTTVPSTEDLMEDEDDEMLEHLLIEDGKTKLLETTKEKILSEKQKKNKELRVSKVVRKLITGAKEMTRAASSMLSKIASGQVFMCNEFCYDMTAITNLELIFYKERSNLKTIVALKADLYQEAYKIPWSPLPLPALSEADKQRIENDRKEFEERAAKANALCEKVLLKKGFDKGEFEEFVPRTDQPKTTAGRKNTVNNSSTNKNLTKAEKRKNKLNDVANNILQNSGDLNALDGMG